MWECQKLRISIAAEDATALAGIFTITTDRDTVTQQYLNIAVIMPMQVLPGPLRRAASRPKDES
jgi:hypothetical protein